MDKLKHLKGEFILIPIDKNLLPFKGILAIIDWNTNLCLSNALNNKLLDFETNKNILINTEKKLNVNKTILIQNKNNLSLKILELIKSFNAKSFTIILTNDFKINLKDFFKSLKSNNLKWNSTTNLATKHEKIIYFNEVTCNGLQ